MMDYVFVVSPLSAEDGGGFVAYVPDLPGCMSDGDTPEEATRNVQLAIKEWLDCAVARKMEVPPPGSRIAAASMAHKRLSAAFSGLVKDVEDMRANVGHLDHRLDEIERKIAELDERFENNQAWARFGDLIGKPEGEETKPLHAC